MILVFGGAYQGKLRYALGRFGYNDDDVFLCDDSDACIPGGKKIVYELDKWLLALVRAGADTDLAVRQFISDNMGAVVIINDISCGVVPTDPVERIWREAVGNALAVVAGESDEVIRMFCGIPMVLKS